jgi:hypothetical protein
MTRMTGSADALVDGDFETAKPMNP